MKLQVQRLEEQQRKSLSSSEWCPIWTVKAFLEVNKRLKDDEEFAKEFVSYKIVIVKEVWICYFFFNSAREHYSVTLNKPRSSEIHHESNDGTLQTSGSNVIHPKRKINSRNWKPFYLTKVYTQLKSKPFINLSIYLYIFINIFFCVDYISCYIWLV